MTEHTAEVTANNKKTSDFLIMAINQALYTKVQTAAGFIDRFPPEAIMSFLAQDADVRARILTHCAKLGLVSSRRLASTLAGELLREVLAAEETTVDEIFSRLTAADAVRTFPHPALWAFVISGDWYKSAAKEGKDLMGILLSNAFESGLIGPSLRLEQLGIKQLAQALPNNLLQELFEDAALGGVRSQPFTAERVFKTVKVDHLVKHFPLEYLFTCLLAPLAEQRGFTLAPPSSRRLSDDGPPTRAASALGRANSSAPAPAAEVAAEPPPVASTGEVTGTGPKPGRGAPNKKTIPLMGQPPPGERPPVPSGVTVPVPGPASSAGDTAAEEGWSEPPTGTDAPPPTVGLVSREGT